MAMSGRASSGYAREFPVRRDPESNANGPTVGLLRCSRPDPWDGEGPRQPRQGPSHIRLEAAALAHRGDGVSSLGQPLQLAPGARVFVRGAEWVIRRVDQCSGEGMQVTCDGISELVRGQEGVFLTSLDADITLLDPAKTALVPDISSGFVQGRLFIESQLREAVPNDRSLWAGHRAAMDPAAYQLEPARQALCQPRQRILIADAVGLGKTLEAGILVSELIARGRGRRILVLAIKSMLTQFQKEFWNRFTIPLTRLDSDGLRRVRSRIPTNHNPFYYYDKSIISIDTLKRSSEYRTYLEDAYWDIIVIDEAHNVADRGTGSQRAQLARLLAKRSDTLVMLSATPHDGKARSFASLMNMLDPTAIADPDSYAKEDFSGKGLVVRRFKKDIRSEVSEVFKDRRVYSIEATATPAEEAAFEALLRVKVSQKRSGSGKRELFQVGLEKALFSSHEACLETVKQRIGKQRKALEKEASKGIEEEVESLEKLKVALGRIDRESSSRYQRLLRAIRGEPLEWKPRDPDDRVVIFTERIATMKWLGEGLQKDLRLSEGQLGTLDGSIERHRPAARRGGVREPREQVADAGVLGCRIGGHQLALPLPPADPLRHAVVAAGVPAAERADRSLRAGPHTADCVPRDAYAERDDPGGPADTGDPQTEGPEGVRAHRGPVGVRERPYDRGAGSGHGGGDRRGRGCVGLRRAPLATRH